MRPVMRTMVSYDGAEYAANLAFDIVYTGEGEALIEVSVPELYDGDRNALVATVVSTEIPEFVEEVLVGDMDGDGILTVLDGLAIIKMFVNETYSALADANGDGKVTLADAIRIFKLLAQ